MQILEQFPVGYTEKYRQGQAATEILEFEVWKLGWKKLPWWEAGQKVQSISVPCFSKFLRVYN